MTRARPMEAEIWEYLGGVCDPELPFISVVDLGIVRGINWEGGTLIVTITPTYSGCPATRVIHRDIESCLRDFGVGRFRIEQRLSPAWTTSWISAAGRSKLYAHGIVPPIEGRTVQGGGREDLVVGCPRCGGEGECISWYGSTPCKSSYRCVECWEPFDYFKCL